MTAEREKGDLRLVETETYSVEEYMFRLEAIGLQYPKDSVVRKEVEKMVSQAKGRPSGTTVRFERFEDGLIHPIFESTLFVEVKDFQI